MKKRTIMRESLIFLSCFAFWFILSLMFGPPKDNINSYLIWFYSAVGPAFISTYLLVRFIILTRSLIYLIVRRSISSRALKQKDKLLEKDIPPEAKSIGNLFRALSVIIALSLFDPVLVSDTAVSIPNIANIIILKSVIVVVTSITIYLLASGILKLKKLSLYLSVILSVVFALFIFIYAAIIAENRFILLVVGWPFYLAYFVVLSIIILNLARPKVKRAFGERNPEHTKDKGSF